MLLELELENNKIKAFNLFAQFIIYLCESEFIILIA